MQPELQEQLPAQSVPIQLPPVQSLRPLDPLQGEPIVASQEKEQP